MKIPGKSVISSDLQIIFSPSLARAFSVLGALVIQQIHYWVCTKPTYIDGHAWHRNTYEAWAKQLEIYTVDALRKKVKELEQLGIVRAGVYNNRKYDRTRWYRLDYVVLASELSARVGGQWISDPLPSGSQIRMVPDLTTGPIPESTGEITEEITSGSPLPQLPACPETVFDNPGENMPKPTTKTSADQILKDFKAKKASGLSEFTVSPKGVYLRWVNEVPKYHPEVKYLPPFTASELGMAGRMVKAWGLDTQKVLQLVILQWVAFTKYAEKMGGAYKTPLIPSFAFLSKYQSLAYNWYLTEQGDAANCTHVNEPKPVKQPSGGAVKVDELGKPATLPPEDDKPITFEELLEVEASLNSGGSGSVG